jgi:hypothetical protein
MTEDPRQADLSEVLTPGKSPVGDGGYGEPKTSLTEKPPLEAFDFAAPGMPQGWQELADWSSQPPPAFAGEAKTIHFWLNHHSSGIVHRGLLFFKPASPPFSYFSRNRFYGTGYVIPNVPWGELYCQRQANLDQLPAFEY